jgi:3',5'-nucleoside bisphosphate phosphatase
LVDYDLHIHSNFSDGILTPLEIIKKAVVKKLKGIAITDHDSVDAISSAIKLSYNYEIDFIPGIELSTSYYENEVHILGYYIDYENPELLKMLHKLKTERFERLIKMIKKINILGYDLTIEELLEILGPASDLNSLGRPHLARALVYKGYFKNIQDVFIKLLSNGMPGYVERLKFKTQDGIALIKKFGGVPVIAHPGLIKTTTTRLENIIDDLVLNGLSGIEVYHTDQSIETSSYLTKLAYKNDLIITGGSDFHAESTQRTLYIGAKGVPAINVMKLKEIAGR